MAKMTRKAAALKAPKAKPAANRNSPAATAPSKAGTATKAGSAAGKKPAAKSASGPAKSLPRKIAGAFEAVLDTLTDAERLHHRLDPDPTKDSDPE